MTAVAAQVATVMAVAIVAAEVARETAGVTAEQPLMGRVAGTSQPCLRLGQIQGFLMSQRTVASYRRRAEAYVPGNGDWGIDLLRRR